MDQDAIKVYDELDEWEKSNVQSDTLAKEALRKYVREGRLVIDTSMKAGDKWIMTLDNTQITNDIKQVIYNSKWLEKGK